MGDSCRQVSWLTALARRLRLPAECRQWLEGQRSPLTVAGAATASIRRSHRVPFSPLAFRLGDHQSATLVFRQSQRNKFSGVRTAARSRVLSEGAMQNSDWLCNNVTFRKTLLAPVKPFRPTPSTCRPPSLSICAVRNFDQTASSSKRHHDFANAKTLPMRRLGQCEDWANVKTGPMRGAI